MITKNILHCNILPKKFKFYFHWPIIIRIRIRRPLKEVETSKVFTALHGMHTRSDDENSVSPSVCPSVRHTLNCDKTVERYVQIHIPYARTFSLVFSEEEWLVGGDPFHLKVWVNRPRWRKITDFEQIIARSASAVTPSEKSSINANRKSTTRFPMS